MTGRGRRRWMVGIALLCAVTLIGGTVVACGEEEAEPEAEPTATAEATETAEPSPTEAGTGDVVDVLQADGRFTQLTTALQNAALIRIGYGLKGEGPLTVLAPTDDAFAKIPQEQLDALMADPMGALQQVLTYHVAEGELMAADVSDGLEVVTLQGEPITFAVDGETVTVDGAQIIETDIEASNGVIHVIDSVMVPPSLAAQGE